MAVQTLLDGVSVAGAGNGVSHASPATVKVRGDSTLKGCHVIVEHANADTDGQYKPVDDQGTLVRPGQTVNIEAKGTYYLRGKVVAPSAGVEAGTVIYLESNSA